MCLGAILCLLLGAMLCFETRLRGEKCFFFSIHMLCLRASEDLFGRR